MLQQQCEALITHNRHLETALDSAQAAAARLDYTGLGGRAQDLLRIAEEQAHDVTPGPPRTPTSCATRRRPSSITARPGRGGTPGHPGAQLAELETLRSQGEQDAAELAARARAEAKLVARRRPA